MWQFLLQHMGQLVGQLIGVFIGGLVTFVVSWLFYKKAGNELREEAAAIRKVNHLLCLALERAGMAEFKRNDKGEMTGLYVPLKGTFRVGSQMTGKLTTDDQNT